MNRWPLESCGAAGASVFHAPVPRLLAAVDGPHVHGGEQPPRQGLGVIHPLPLAVLRDAARVLQYRRVARLDGLDDQLGRVDGWGGRVEGEGADSSRPPQERRQEGGPPAKTTPSSPDTCCPQSRPSSCCPPPHSTAARIPPPRSAAGSPTARRPGPGQSPPRGRGTAGGGGLGGSDLLPSPMTDQPLCSSIQGQQPSSRPSLTRGSTGSETSPSTLPQSEKSTSTRAGGAVAEACSRRLLIATRYETTSSRSTTAVTTL
jgi:hypothetical protein